MTLSSDLSTKTEPFGHCPSIRHQTSRPIGTSCLKRKMYQVSIRAPQVTTTGPKYSFPYAMYLHSSAWLLRKAVATFTGTGELFDKTLHVDTPGLGEGYVTISVCLPKTRSNEDPGSAKPLLLVAEGGGFVLGQPTDGEHIVRRLSDKVTLSPGPLRRNILNRFHHRS